MKNPESQGPSGGGAATSAGIIFEQRLGVLIAAWILAERPLDARLGLGEALPVWIRFETEAPVDDILVSTSSGGFVAIQAKTAVSLSRDPASPFGKTIRQFVRQWLACRDGAGSLGWDRPLDISRDRLVLAVGPQAAASVRFDLPAALRLRSQPGGATLTQAQARAFSEFEACVRMAWSGVTSKLFDETIIAELSRLIVVFTFDPDGADAIATTTLLSTILPKHADPAGALASLAEISGTLMSQRGGGDIGTLRRALAARGVVLGEPIRFHADIATLRTHSKKIAQSLLA